MRSPDCKLFWLLRVRSLFFVLSAACLVSCAVFFSFSACSICRFWYSAFFSAKVMGGLFGDLSFTASLVSLPAGWAEAAGGVYAAPGAFRIRCLGTDAGGGWSEYCLTPRSSIHAYWAAATAAAIDNKAASAACLHHVGFIGFPPRILYSPISPCFDICVNRIAVPYSKMLAQATNFVDFCIMRLCADRNHHASTSKSTHIR